MILRKRLAQIATQHANVRGKAGPEQKRAPRHQTDAAHGLPPATLRMPARMRVYVPHRQRLPAID